MKVKVQIEITPQQICDLFVTAVEGGMNYWCNKAIFYQNAERVSYQEVSSFEGTNWSVAIWADDCDDNPNTIAAFDLVRACEALPERFLQIIDESYDAETADCLVQQAAFGDIVYG